MVNIAKTAMATGIFFLFYGLVVIDQHIVPPLIDATDALSADLSKILYFGYIIINILLLTIIPMIIMYNGITETDEEPINPVKNITIAILYFLFAMAITYFTYYMLTPMQNQINDEIFQIAFWIGVVTLYLINIIGIPAYMIIQARNTQ